MALNGAEIYVVPVERFITLSMFRNVMGRFRKNKVWKMNHINAKKFI